MYTCLKIQIFQLFKWLKRTLDTLMSCHPGADACIKAKCAEDFFFWYEFFVCSIYPEKAENKPYNLLEPYQINYINRLIVAIENKNDMLVEKSVNMGATTMTALVFLWFWLYKKDCNLMILTKNSSELKKIFALYKELLLHLPRALRGEKLNKYFEQEKINHKGKNSKGALRLLKRPRQSGILKNPDNGNVLYVLSAYRRVFPAHSIAFQAIFFDDYSFQRFQKEHWKTFEKFGCARIGVSCPNGNANFFYELKNSGIEVYRLHWALKELASKEWYKACQQGHDPVFVEQFMNINYSVRQVKKRSAACKVNREEAVVRKPNRLTFTQWAQKNPETHKEHAIYRRHINAEELEKPATYEDIQEQLTDQLEQLANQQTEVKAVKSRCLCSLGVAIQVISEFSGIDIQSHFFNREKKLAYMKVSVSPRELSCIPYDAQVSEDRFERLKAG